MKNQQEGKWIHPAHARGVKSQNLGSLFRGGILTDSQIHTYCLEGKYGEAARLRAEASDRRRVTDGKKAKRKVKTEMQKHIDGLLEGLL